MAHAITPLFRSEAVAAQRDQWLGRTVCLRPIPLTLAAIVGLALVLLVGLFFIFGEYTHRVRLTGTVVPEAGVVRVFATSSGRIASEDVVEGEAVRADQRLYVIASDSRTAFGNTQAAVEAQLRLQRAELDAEILRRRDRDAIEKRGLIEQQRFLEREIKQIRAQITATDAYAASLKTTSETYSELARRHVVLAREALDRTDSHMRKAQEAETLRREAIQLDEKLGELKTRLARFDGESDTALGELKRQISTLDRDLIEGEARRQTEVTAPGAGLVTAVLAKPGQLVGAGTPLLSIVPENAKLEIQLFGDSRVIGFMRKGAHVMVRYAAYPYQKFGLYPGTVTDFSHTTLRPGDAEAMPERDQVTAGATGLYRITVRPDQDHVQAYGRPEPVRPGMSVEADVFLDSRPLYQWLLEPLYSLRGAIGGEGPSV